MSDTNDVYGSLKIKKGVKDIHIHDDGTNAIIDPTSPLIAKNITELDFQYGQSQYSAAGFVKVTQTLNGFSVKEVLRNDPISGLYVRAQANTADNAEVYGVVTVVIDANTFIMCIGGFVSTFSGLTAGDVLFLSDGVPGQLTTVEPTTHGSISKPLVLCKSATEGIFVNMRGIEVPGSMSTFPADHVTYDNSVSHLVATNVQAAIDEHVTDTTNPHDTSDQNLIVTNNTANNVTIAAHGFTPKLSNVATQYLSGDGSWSTPSGVANAYKETSYAGVSTKTVIHNFGARPCVQVLDDAASPAQLIPKSIVHDSTNQFTVTFDVASSGTIIATLGSPQPQSVRVVAADTLITNSDRIVSCSASGKTMTLPTAVGVTGIEFKIDNASTGNIFLAAQAGEFIQGLATQTLPADSCIAVFSNGTGYRIC